MLREIGFIHRGFLHKLIYMSERGNGTVVILHALPILNPFIAARLKKGKVSISALFQQIYYA